MKGKTQDVKNTTFYICFAVMKSLTAELKEVSK